MKTCGVGMALAVNSVCLLFLPVALLLSKYRNMTPAFCKNAFAAESLWILVAVRISVSELLLFEVFTLNDVVG